MLTALVEPFLIPLPLVVVYQPLIKELMQKLPTKTPEFLQNCKRLRFAERIPLNRLTWIILIGMFFMGLMLSILGGIVFNLGEAWNGFWLNIGTELIGAAITFIFLNWFIQQREKRETLVELVKNKNNEIAINALTELKEIGLLNKENSVLRGKEIREAQWRGAKLQDCGLQDIFLPNAQLEGADLSGADLSGANLESANLSNARLNGSNLSKTNLRGAVLKGADLCKADINHCEFNRADLSEIPKHHLQELQNSNTAVFFEATMQNDTKYRPGTTLDDYMP
jgi:hypothetical protein